MQTTDSATVLSAYTVSSEKIGFGFHTWVISREGLAPAPYPMPLLIYCRNPWKEAGSDTAKLSTTPTHNFNLPFLQILLLHFTAKENGPAIQIPS